MAEEQERASEEMVTNLSDAVKAIMEEVVEKSPEIAERGPPVAIAIVALWPDSHIRNWSAGPAAHPGVILQMLGHAGVDTARQMAVPVGEESEKKLIVPSNAIIVPH